MARKKFREVVGQNIEGDKEKYWKPNTVGEQIEGTILEFKEGQFGEQIILKLEDGDEVQLPAHKDLQNKQDDLYEKDYIRVTLSGFKKANNPDFNDKPLYKVEVAED